MSYDLEHLKESYNNESPKTYHQPLLSVSSIESSIDNYTSAVIKPTDNNNNNNNTPPPSLSTSSFPTSPGHTSSVSFSSYPTLANPNNSNSILSQGMNERLSPYSSTSSSASSSPPPSSPLPQGSNSNLPGLQRSSPPPLLPQSQSQSQSQQQQQQQQLGGFSSLSMSHAQNHHPLPPLMGGGGTETIPFPAIDPRISPLPTSASTQSPSRSSGATSFTNGHGASPFTSTQSQPRTQSHRQSPPHEMQDSSDHLSAQPPIAAQSQVMYPNYVTQTKEERREAQHNRESRRKADSLNLANGSGNGSGGGGGAGGLASYPVQRGPPNQGNQTRYGGSVGYPASGHGTAYRQQDPYSQGLYPYAPHPSHMQAGYPHPGPHDLHGHQALSNVPSFPPHAGPEWPAKQHYFPPPHTAHAPQIPLYHGHPRQPTHPVGLDTPMYGHHHPVVHHPSNQLPPPPGHGNDGGGDFDSSTRNFSMLAIDQCLDALSNDPIHGRYHPGNHNHNHRNGLADANTVMGGGGEYGQGDVGGLAYSAGSGFHHPSAGPGPGPHSAIPYSPFSHPQMPERRNDDIADNGFVYHVQFKRSHRNFLLSSQAPPNIKVGDFVKVEADRGEDLGIVCDVVPMQQLRGGLLLNKLKTGNGVKRILRLASPQECLQLSSKMEEEELVVKMCRERALNVYMLPMTIADAEYQFDRHKLTIFYEANRRIDFRELVRDLFAVYKTRIWMEHVTYSFRPNEGAARALATGLNHHFFTTSTQNVVAHHPPSTPSHSSAPSSKNLSSSNSPPAAVPLQPTGRLSPSPFLSSHSLHSSSSSSPPGGAPTNGVGVGGVGVGVGGVGVGVGVGSVRGSTSVNMDAANNIVGQRSDSGSSYSPISSPTHPSAALAGSGGGGFSPFRSSPPALAPASTTIAHPPSSADSPTHFRNDQPPVWRGRGNDAMSGVNSGGPVM